MASEIDFDSTLLGGTTELVTAILQAPELDSWPVHPTTRWPTTPIGSTLCLSPTGWRTWIW